MLYIYISIYQSHSIYIIYIIIYKFGQQHVSLCRRQRDMLVTRLKLNLPDYKQRLCGSFRDMDSWVWCKSEHGWIRFKAMNYNDLFNCIRLYIYIISNIPNAIQIKLIFAANWSKTVKDLRFLGQKWYDQGPGSSSCCMAAAGLAFHGSGCSGGPGASSPGRLWLPRCGSFPVDISLKLQHFASDARLQSTSKESKDKL